MGGGGFITDNRRLINVLQVINRQWYVMGARSEADVMNLSAPFLDIVMNRGDNGDESARLILPVHSAGSHLSHPVGYRHSPNRR